MRFKSGYHILYSIIVMGSYTRSFFFVSLIGLIGIGICLVLEQRRRNLGQSPSESQMEQLSWVQGRTKSSETVTNSSHPSCNRLSLNGKFRKNEGSTNDLLNSRNTKETEDDVTCLFTLSNMNMDNKSWPGLPGMNIDSMTFINFKNQNDKLTLLRDAMEMLESKETVITELQCDVDAEDNSTDFLRNRKSLEYGMVDISKNNIDDDIQTHVKTRENSGEPSFSAFVNIMEEAPRTNADVLFCEEEPKVTIREINDSSGLCGFDNDEDYVAHVLPELQSSILRNSNEHVFDNNNLVLSGFGDVSNFSQSEETLLVQSVRDSLENAWASIPSASETTKGDSMIQSLQDSTLEALYKEKTNSDIDLFKNDLPHTQDISMQNKEIEDQKITKISKEVISETQGSASLVADISLQNEEIEDQKTTEISKEVIDDVQGSATMVAEDILMQNKENEDLKITEISKEVFDEAQSSASLDAQDISGQNEQIKDLRITEISKEVFDEPQSSASLVAQDILVQNEQIKDLRITEISKKVIDEAQSSASLVAQDISGQNEQIKDLRITEILKEVFDEAQSSASLVAQDISVQNEQIKDLRITEISKEVIDEQDVSVQNLETEDMKIPTTSKVLIDEAQSSASLVAQDILVQNEQIKDLLIIEISKEVIDEQDVSVQNLETEDIKIPTTSKVLIDEDQGSTLLVAPDILVQNEQIEDLKIIEFSKEIIDEVQGSSFLFANNISNVQPEIQSSNGHTSDNNIVVLSGLVDGSHFLQSEETLLVQSVEKASTSIPSDPQTKKYSSQNSSSEAVHEKVTGLQNKFPETRSTINGLPYTDLAAIPKKVKIKHKAGTKSSNIGIPIDTEKDKILEMPIEKTKHRVRKLVGFFENKMEKN